MDRASHCWIPKRCRRLGYVLGYYLDNRRTAVLLTEKRNAAGERDLQWASGIRSICEEKQG